MTVFIMSHRDNRLPTMQQSHWKMVLSLSKELYHFNLPAPITHIGLTTLIYDAVTSHTKRCVCVCVCCRDLQRASQYITHVWTVTLMTAYCL